MGFFDKPLFDFNRNGKTDGFELFVGMQMMANSCRDDFDTDGDIFEDNELIEELEMAGLDLDDLADMDEEERREALEDAGLDPDDFDEF